MRLIEKSLTKTLLESLYESVDAVYNHLGERCPKCGSGNYFEVDGAEYDDGTQEFKLVCADCGYESSTDELNCNDLNEAEEVKEDKKVTKVEVLILPTIKFMWAEGNQDHIKALFGSAEEHDMDFSKFQNAVYTLDQEVSGSRGGYNKVKYVANIQVKFTYEDGSTSEETSTYTGRVDCGDGYKYVTVSKNMKHFIQDVYKDAEVIVKEDDTAELKESTETGKMTLKDYAMNYFDGDVDIDVTDTEIGVLVAFVYDFNEEPKDNYDRFLNLLGERTEVVKVGNNGLICDFSSVFKPYEDKLQGFFDMDYSEFNEAWAEAVSNLEALISGNAGEKTYGELVDILNSKQINESASVDSGKDHHKFTDMVMELHSYVEEEPGKISRDLKAAIKSNKLEDYLKHKAAMDDEEISNFVKKYFRENMNESFDPDKTAKRVARYKEFDNGHVFHSWLEDKTADEVEELARLASIKNPDDVYYVQYDDVMNGSEYRYVNGVQYNINKGGFHWVNGLPKFHTDADWRAVSKREKTWEEIDAMKESVSSDKSTEVSNFIKDSVDKLQNTDYTNCKYNLDDTFAIYVGWSDGYDANDINNDLEIHSKKNPSYAINAIVGVRNDADFSDLDYITIPYYESGDIYNCQYTVSPKEDYIYLADSLLKAYEDIKEKYQSGELLIESNILNKNH